MLSCRAMKNSKVILLGFDGATFDALNPLVEQGKLPTIARLIHEGVSAPLMSTIHPLTPCAWSSMVTGLNPGKHGIFDFRRRRPGTYALEIVNSRLRDGAALWTILTQHGKKVGVFNVPLTFPPDPVKGFMISGMDAPRSSSFTYPAALQADIQGVIGNYSIDVNGFCSDAKEYANRILRMLDNRIDTFHYLLQRYSDLDFLMAVFVAPDRLQHAFWKYLDPGAPEFGLAEAEFFRSAFERCYRRLDDLIGELLQGSSEDTTIMVVSDHGFGPLYKDVYLNRWLIDHSFLRLKEPSPDKGSAFFDSVGWSQTKAYSFGYFGNIYLNLRGREPAGIVEEGKEAEDLRRIIIKELGHFRDPESGQPMVDSVFRREELYWGPHIREAPDLLVIMRNYAYMTRDGYEGVSPTVVGPPMQYQTNVIQHSGNHRIEGLCMMRGAPVRVGARMKRAGIMDIAPTVLYLMGLPISPEMDGRVLEEAVERSHLRARPIKIAVSPVQSSRRRRSLQEALVVKDGEITRLREKVRDREEEIAELKHRLARTHQGRFMRFMARVHALRRAVHTKVNVLLGRASPPG